MRITIKEIVIEVDEHPAQASATDAVETARASAYDSMKGRPAEVHAGKVLLETRVVRDNPMNNGSEFWKHHIGKIVGVIKQTPDGLMDIQLPEQLIPIEGVDPKRLT